MKILIYGPKDRYDTYMPDFAADLPFETVFSSAVQPALQAAEENPDAEIVFADAITPTTREIMDALPRLKMIHSEGVAYNAIDVDAAREKGVFVCNNKGCNAVSVRNIPSCSCSWPCAAASPAIGPSLKAGSSSSRSSLWYPGPGSWESWTWG